MKLEKIMLIPEQTRSGKKEDMEVPNNTEKEITETTRLIRREN